MNHQISNSRSCSSCFLVHILVMKCDKFTFALFEKSASPTDVMKIQDLCPLLALSGPDMCASLNPAWLLLFSHSAEAAVVQLASSQSPE